MLQADGYPVGPQIHTLYAVTCYRRTATWLGRRLTRYMPLHATGGRLPGWAEDSQPELGRHPDGLHRRLAPPE